MAKANGSNATTTGTVAAPQYYEAIHYIGMKPDQSGPYRPGDRFTADELLAGLDPDYIATRMPELVAKGAIKPVDGPAPTS